MAFIDFRFAKDNHRTFYVTLNDEVAFEVNKDSVYQIDTEECCIQINSTAPWHRRKALAHRRSANRSDNMLWKAWKTKLAQKAEGEEWVIELPLQEEDACVLYLPTTREDRLVYNKKEQLSSQMIQKYTSRLCTQ